MYTLTCSPFSSVFRPPREVLRTKKRLGEEERDGMSSVPLYALLFVVLSLPFLLLLLFLDLSVRVWDVYGVCVCNHGVATAENFLP